MIRNITKISTRPWTRGYYNTIILKSDDGSMSVKRINNVTKSQILIEHKNHLIHGIEVTFIGSGEVPVEISGHNAAVLFGINESGDEEEIPEQYWDTILDNFYSDINSGKLVNLYTIFLDDPNRTTLAKLFTAECNPDDIEKYQPVLIKQNGRYNYFKIETISVKTDGTYLIHAFDISGTEHFNLSALPNDVCTLHADRKNSMETLLVPEYWPEILQKYQLLIDTDNEIDLSMIGAHFNNYTEIINKYIGAEVRIHQSKDWFLFKNYSKITPWQIVGIDIDQPDMVLVKQLFTENKHWVPISDVIFPFK